MPSGVNMTKLHDHLAMPIGAIEPPLETPTAEAVDRTYQLGLPFDQPINLELRVSPSGTDPVQFEVHIKVSGANLK
jgi:hypothetical protein